MNVRMDDQGVRLEIVAEHRGVRDALMLQADELKETLSRQNIKMESFSVTTGDSDSMARDRQDWRQAGTETGQKKVQQNAPANPYGGNQMGDAQVRYFAPQYQSTIDVRF